MLLADVSLHIIYLSHTQIVKKPTCTILLQSVPYIAIEIIIATQQQPAALAERDAGDAADYAVIRVHADLLVGPRVEQSARGIVTARGKSKTVGEECDRVDVGFVSRERLLALAVAQIP